MHCVEAKGLLSAGNGINVYRGCTHGCIYCDSRSLCYQMKHPFEDVEVKVNAPQLLEDALRRKRRRCMIATGAMSDPYMPCEEELGLTRRCLEQIAAYGFGAAVQTKSNRVLRDLDLFRQIHRQAKCVVQMTLTTYDESLCRVIEPHVCTTKARVDTLCTLHEEGIPTVVWLSPFLPFLNDTEENLRALLQCCVRAKVSAILCFGIGVTLRAGDREYYYAAYAALDRTFPGLRSRYEQKYGDAYEVMSDRNAALMRLFHQECRHHGIESDRTAIFSWLRSFPEQEINGQIRLF